jgi:hypothetical protein
MTKVVGGSKSVLLPWGVVESLGGSREEARSNPTATAWAARRRKRADERHQKDEILEGLSLQ